MLNVNIYCLMKIVKSSLDESHFEHHSLAMGRKIDEI